MPEASGGSTGLPAIPGVNFGAGATPDLSATSGSGGQFSPYAPVMVSPVATNLGSILQAYSGPPENGGGGLVPRSRLTDAFTARFFGDAPGNNNMMLYAIAGVIGLAAFYFGVKK